MPILLGLTSVFHFVGVLKTCEYAPIKTAEVPVKKTVLLCCNALEVSTARPGQTVPQRSGFSCLF